MSRYTPEAVRLGDARLKLDAEDSIRAREMLAKIWWTHTPSPRLPSLVQSARSPGLDSPCRSLCRSVGAVGDCRGERDVVSIRPDILYSV